MSYSPIKPDPDRLQALMELPLPLSCKSLQRIIGLFAYCSKWMLKFSDKIEPLSDCKVFSIEGEALTAFENLKKELGEVAPQNIDEGNPFVVKRDASEVAFMSREFEMHELYYSSVEKEATAIIESAQKWEHLLRCKHFTLITDQCSVTFVMDNRKRTKIKNNKILNWRLESASLSYTIQYRPNPENVAADTLSRSTCSAQSNKYSLEEIHAGLCHASVTRLLQYVRSQNLTFSTDEVGKVCRTCQVCAEIKPQFYKKRGDVLIKATKPIEQLSIDFKSLLKSSTRNKYFLVAIDEYSRFPFVFPRWNMETS